MYSNGDDSTGLSEWREVSLRPDSVQEVRGRLRFRKDSRTFSEAENVESDRRENDVTGTASGIMPGENDDIKRSNESLAYQYGMKVLWGAAKAVSAVADGGKQNREVIKTLRADLKQMGEKYDQLRQELENSKQWVAYYENVKGGLEYQVEENKKRYAADVSVMQEKIQGYEGELDNYRKELAEAITLRDNLLSDVGNAQASIAKLKFQVEKAQQIMAEHVKMPRTAAEHKSTNTAAVQVQLDSNPDPESRLMKLKEELKTKEETMQNVVSALQRAESGGDELRHRLMTSLAEIKSQAMVMRSLRVAYDAAACEKRCLKEELRHKMKENDNVVRKLEVEIKIRDEKTKELEHKNNLLKEVMEAKTQLERQQVVGKKKILKKHKQAMEETKTKHMAEIIVASVINEALAIQQKNFHCKLVEDFEVENEKLTSNLSAIQGANEQLKNETLFLLDDLRTKDTLLEQKDSKIHELIEAMNGYKSDLDVKENNIKQLNNALSLSERKTFQITEKFQNDINAKGSEITNLRLQVRALKQENVNLQFKVQQVSIQPVKADASAQINIRNQEVDELKCNLNAALKRNDSMQLQLQSADEKSVARENELLAQIKALQTNVSNLTKEKHDLNAALSREREESHNYYSQYYAQYEQYCKDLEWQCQLNNRDVHQLYQENLELRQYIEKWNSTVYSAGYNRYRSYSTSPYNQYSQRQYDHYHNIQQYTYDQGHSGKRYCAQPLETITENEERSPTNCHEPSSIPQPTSLSPVTTNETSTDPIVVVSLDSPQQVPAETDIIKMNESSEKSSKKARKLPVCRTHCLPDSGQNTASSLQADKASNLALESDEDTLTLKFPQNPPQRLFGIPMPEDVYERIIAGEDITDWQPDIVVAPDDGYSSTSCDSFRSEIFSHRSNDVDKINDSAFFAPKSNEENLNFLVTYKDVEFDMIGLSVSQIRNITTACGAIGSQSEMNAFYDFLAAKTKEMNDDPRWSGYDKLESPEDWLSLKQEAFV